MTHTATLQTVVQDIVGQIAAGGCMDAAADIAVKAPRLTEFMLNTAHSAAAHGLLPADACYALKAAAILLEVAALNARRPYDADETPSDTERMLDVFDGRGEREMGLRLLDDPHDFLRWFISGCAQLNVYRYTSVESIEASLKSRRLSARGRNSFRDSFEILLKAGW